MEITDSALDGIGETRKRNEQERAEEKKTVGKKEKELRRRHSGIAERKGTVRFRNKEAGEKREERAALEATRLEQQQQQQQQQQQLALMQQQMMGMFQQQQQMQPLLSFLPKKE